MKRGLNRCVFLFFLLLSTFFFDWGCTYAPYTPIEIIKIFSTPVDAQVYINGVYRGRTPIFVALRKRNNYTIEIKKDGYKPKLFKIYSVLAYPIYITGIFDGAAYELSQSQINADLEPLQVPDNE